MFFTTTGDDCCPDWLVECQNFVCGDALQDAIFRSLFTRNRDPECETGGYWANPDLGSGLHRVVPGLRANESLARLEDETRSALQWMEGDGIVSGLSVSSEYVASQAANILIGFERPEECSFSVPATAGEFGWVWNYGITSRIA